MTSTRTALLVAALFGLCALPATPSQARDWPQRAVRFIVPLGAGSGVDIGARLFADRLSARWGKPVVVENRPGGPAEFAAAISAQTAQVAAMAKALGIKPKQ
jgi:tripartite-type tricarboxylate transporter receptor subunit TctC